MIIFLLIGLTTSYQILFQNLEIKYSELINEEYKSTQLLNTDEKVKGLIYPSVSENIWIFEFDGLVIERLNLEHPVSYYFEQVWDKKVGLIDMRNKTNKIKAWKLNQPYDSYIETSILRGQKWKIDIYPPSNPSIFLSFSFIVENSFDHKYLQQFRYILEKK